jgi:hypothetical protein
MKKVLPLLTLGFAVAAVGGGPAWAEETAPPEAIVDVTVSIVAETSDPTQVTEPLFAGRVLGDDELAENRGGANTEFSTIRAVGTVSEVTASDLVTGHNIITNGALAGASGLPMFIQNSGNGVLIQNAVIVNLDMN